MLDARLRTAGALLLSLALLALGSGIARADAFSPVVVVFPFQPNGAVPNQLGTQIAMVLAQHIADGGEITVKPPPPGSTPQSYQHDAQGLGAGFYISGYVTPFGNYISIVEYVVSVRTGTIIYSSNAEASNVNDVVSQADTLKRAVLGLAAVAAAPEAAPAPTPAPSPAPPKRGRGARRTSAATPAPTAPAPTAAPAAVPTPRVVSAAAAGQRWVVVDVAGGLNAGERAQAQQALVSALKERGVDAVSDDDPAPQGPSLAKVICTLNGGTNLVVASVNHGRSARRFHGSIDATLLACASATAQRQVSGVGHSVAEAAQAAASALLAPAPQRRHRR